MLQTKKPKSIDANFFTNIFTFQIAREHNITFYETSAKANINIDIAFYYLAESILNKVGER